MLLYQYIAESNPDACIMLLHRYGYANQQFNTFEDIAASLQTMVASEGEDSFKELMKLHPDKDVIVEQFSQKTSDMPVAKNFAGCDGSSSSCGCSGCRSNSMKNATGDFAQTANIATQTNTFILLGAVIVAVAILTSAKAS